MKVSKYNNDIFLLQKSTIQRAHLVKRHAKRYAIYKQGHLCQLIALNKLRCLRLFKREQVLHKHVNELCRSSSKVKIIVKHHCRINVRAFTKPKTILALSFMKQMCKHLLYATYCIHFTTLHNTRN